MAEQLPPPPVPPDADLTDFKFMPLEVARLRRSKAWLICKRRPELAFYMLNLWTASWHERPAGSLEDDDDVLADAAMCSPERWAKVRDAAMRGWVKCADGRLYHPVVSEKVNDSWRGRVLSRWEKECDRIRKENHRRKEKGLPSLEFPPKPERISSDDPKEPRRMSAGIPPEKPLKGERREREREEREETLPAAASSGNPPREPVDAPKAAAADQQLGTEPVDGADGPLEIGRQPDPEMAPPLERSTDRPKASADERATVDEAFAMWTPLASELCISDVGFLNTDRRAALSQRLAEVGGLGGWRLFLDKVRAAEFLRMPDGRMKFWVGLGTLLKPEHFSKILEDRYAEQHHRGNDGDERSTSAALAGIFETGSR